MWKLLIDGLGMFAGKAMAIGRDYTPGHEPGPGLRAPGPFGSIKRPSPDGWRRRWPPPGGLRWSAGPPTGASPTGPAGRPAGTPRTRPRSRPPAAGWPARRARTGA